MTTPSTLPNLVMIGVAKAGTTSLFDYLTQHPDICGADEKELFYFTPLRYGEPLAPLSDYAAHFGHCGAARYRMEASPGYYFGGAAVITAIRSALDDPRILLILRDPAERLWSYYRFEQSRANLSKDHEFAEYLATCEDLRRQGLDGLRENNAFWGLSSGFYAEPLKGWLDAFADRMLVVFFEHMAQDPAATVAAICAWAGVDPDASAAFDYGISNPTVQYRSAALRKTAIEFRERNKRWLSSRPMIRSALRTIYRRVNSEGATDRLTQAQREQLEEIYRESNRQVALVLQDHGYPDLPDWLGKALAHS